MAPVKTYKGKKSPINAAKFRLTCRPDDESSFDRIFGTRRSPEHIFSSSNESSQPQITSSNISNDCSSTAWQYTPSKPRFFTLSVTKDVSKSVNSSHQESLHKLKSESNCIRKRNHGNDLKRNKTAKQSSILKCRKTFFLVQECRKKLLASKKKKVLECNFYEPLSNSTPVNFKDKSKAEVSKKSYPNSPVVGSQNSGLSTTNLFEKFKNMNLGSPHFESKSPGASLSDSSFITSLQSIDDMNNIAAHGVLSPIKSEGDGQSPNIVDVGPTRKLDIDATKDFLNNSNCEGRDNVDPLPVGIKGDANSLSFKEEITRNSSHLTTPISESPETLYALPASRPTTTIDGQSDLLSFEISHHHANYYKAYEMWKATAVCPACSQTWAKCCKNPENGDKAIYGSEAPPNVECGAGVKREFLKNSFSSLQSGVGEKISPCSDTSCSTMDDSEERRSSVDLSFKSSIDETDDSDDHLEFNERPALPSQILLFSEHRSLEPLDENCEDAVEEMDDSVRSSPKKSPVETIDNISSRTPTMKRKSSRHSEEKSPTGRAPLGRTFIISELNMVLEEPDNDSTNGDKLGQLEPFVLLPGKKYRRSLAIIRGLEDPMPSNISKGRNYDHLVGEVLRLQKNVSIDDATTPIQTIRKTLSVRRSSWMKQMTPPPRRRWSLSSQKYADRNTFYETPRGGLHLGSTSHVKRLSILLTTGNTSSFNNSRLQTFQSQSWVSHDSLAPLNNTRESSLLCSPDTSLLETSAAEKLDSVVGLKEIILQICGQSEPHSFANVLPEECYEGGCKLGEGVFGEVFSINRGDRKTVLKLIPIEGSFLVNGEKQKTYAEVVSELLVAQELHNLRDREADSYYIAGGFAELIDIFLIQDCYPEQLIKFWNEFDVTKGSDNDSPKVFKDDQLFIAMEQGNGGQALETYSFSSARQALSVFKQIVFSLAVAECSFEFEHRDLHWGNVLVSRTAERDISYIIKGVEYQVKSHGIKGTIIDFTLSRMLYKNETTIFNDVGKDPDMFIATGDYQFEIYRLMKKDLGNEWHRFEPKTNARWLHYLIDKMLKEVKYQRRAAKVHKESIESLTEIESWIQTCDSSHSIALRLADGKY